ncbi:hypothetical protein RN001_005973 [Aquatica leii]|uniref:Uncharacterized protein n=1 Tax=Aquatica leii TaxID=1421715 RepID=A0AAN7PD12_9COLE|nr:hypothetical protein RN001_005973 [Aquatica leii]
MSDEDIQWTPPELRELAIAAINNLLPEKSKNMYEKEYEKFMAWCATKNVTIVTENVTIAFFETISKQYKSSTLWKIYSMLRSVLNIRQNIDISKFLAGYEPKKSHILEYAYIEAFVKEAPDCDYLAVKFVLIMGYSGACRRDELANLSIKYKADSVFVAISNTKTKHTNVFLYIIDNAVVQSNQLV